MEQETITHLNYFAHQNFLSKDECEGIVLSEDSTLVKDKIMKAIFDWNDQPENQFVLDFSDDKIHVVSGTEETGIPMNSAHTLHNGNLREPGWKVQAYIHLASTDEYQGGEMFLKDWPQVPYKDNFGKWIGDPEEPHQPTWLKEQGTLVITDAGAEVGFDITINGNSPKLRILIGGPAYK